MDMYVHLDESEVRELDEVSKPATIYPGWMMSLAYDKTLNDSLDS